ncbi:hypothetical protein [Campylobacter fetus]|uniref:hypothetical protein n=1 Tax=Campylobacter fetus TaxID=196 RepID=UPI0026E0D7DF|nr:hypothetical protein [Campylobacter fetus]WKW21640.1 hypothetical protein IXZ14_04850 [Campylobacter fetus subsp. venerealis]
MAISSCAATLVAVEATKAFETSNSVLRVFISAQRDGKAPTKSSALLSKLAVSFRVWRLW